MAMATAMVTMRAMARVAATATAMATATNDDDNDGNGNVYSSDEHNNISGRGVDGKDLGCIFLFLNRISIFVKYRRLYCRIPQESSGF